MARVIFTFFEVFSTYTDRILFNKELWISNGRIACIKESGEANKHFDKKNLNYYDVDNNFSLTVKAGVHLTKYPNSKKPDNLNKYFEKMKPMSVQQISKMLKTIYSS